MHYTCYQSLVARNNRVRCLDVSQKQVKLSWNTHKHTSHRNLMIHVEVNIKMFVFYHRIHRIESTPKVTFTLSVFDFDLDIVFLLAFINNAYNLFYAKHLYAYQLNDWISLHLISIFISQTWNFRFGWSDKIVS